MPRSPSQLRSVLAGMFAPRQDLSQLLRPFGEGDADPEGDGPQAQLVAVLQVVPG